MNVCVKTTICGRRLSQQPPRKHKGPKFPHHLIRRHRVTGVRCRQQLPTLLCPRIRISPPLVSWRLKFSHFLRFPQHAGVPIARLGQAFLVRNAIGRHELIGRTAVQLHRPPRLALVLRTRGGLLVCSPTDYPRLCRVKCASQLWSIALQFPSKLRVASRQRRWESP